MSLRKFLVANWTILIRTGITVAGGIWATRGGVFQLVLKLGSRRPTSWPILPRLWI